MTHWCAGVFRAESLPNLLPELIIYSLLYDEVLIREEDLITNRPITRLLSDDHNFAVFSELLIAGMVKLLRVPVDIYPANRRFDPVRLPISARVEEHQLRRSYKGNPWKPTLQEWRLFGRLDEIITKYPSASRHHEAFAQGNRFAAQLAEVLDNRKSYLLASHPVFRYINEKTAAQFSSFCQDHESWLRFLHSQGVSSPIRGPDSGFYRSAAYQCSNFFPARRAIRRLVESVYAATYCEREASDGRYGGSELVELPYRYGSQSSREAAMEEALRIEVVPTGATAAISLQPGIAAVLERTRALPEFESMRRTMESLAVSPESPLLAEARFREAWRRLCAAYAENAAMCLEPSKRADHRAARYAVYAYVLARALGILILPSAEGSPDLPVLEDAAAIAGIEKLGPAILRGLRSLVKIPALRSRMDASAGIRCSAVPLTISKEKQLGPF